MELTQAHFERIAHLFPKQRGNVSLSHLTVLDAILYVAEQGCKWRGLPASFGNWHTIDTRMNRWAKPVCRTECLNCNVRTSFGCGWR